MKSNKTYVVASIFTIGLGIAAGLLGACNAPNSVELGGQCYHRNDCMDPADACLQTDDASFCTKQCGGASPCPDVMACVEMEVTMTNSAGSTTIPGMGYCVPKDQVPDDAPIIEPIQW